MRSAGAKLGDREDRSGLAAAFSLLRRGDTAFVLRKALEKFTGNRLPLADTVVAHPRQEEILPAGTRENNRLWLTGPSLQLDGAPISQHELAIGLSSLGFAVDVLSPVDGPLRKRYAGSAVNVLVRPELACSPIVPAWYERDVQRLADLMRSSQPALIVASTIDSFAAIDAARIAGIPSIWNIRESEPWQERLADRHPAIASRALACLSYPVSLIFVAAASREAWGRFATAGRSTVIYNAPSTSVATTGQHDHPSVRTALGVGEEEKLVVSVGTICARKGQIDLALALSSLSPEVTDKLRVVFVGRTEGDYADRVKRALSPQIAHRVAFAGPVENASRYIAAADLLVNSSRSEAFPRTFLEAAATHTPIIATSIAGTVERLTNRRSGLLYQPGNAAELASAMNALLSDVDLATRQAEYAHADLVQAWSYEDMIGAYADQVRNALSPNHEKPA
jgi:glycosyltransferase involved in cell wall biosynthesis